MLYSFTKSKFISLTPKNQAGKLANLLKTILENKYTSKTDLQEYQQYCDWLENYAEHSGYITELCLDDQYHYWNKLSGHNRGPLKVKSKDRERYIKPPMKWAVALDSFRSGHNVGSIFRISDAFGFCKIISGGYTPGPEHKSVQSAGMGAENYVEYEKTKVLSRHLKTLKNEFHGKIVGLESTDKSIPFQEYSFPHNGILVLGNEERGISEEVLAECDEIISIPMYGKKHSLNVSSSFSIIAQRIQDNSTLRSN